MQTNPSKIDQMLKKLGEETESVQPHLWDAIEQSLNAPKKSTWLSPLRIAASILIFFTLGAGLYVSNIFDIQTAKTIAQMVSDKRDTLFIKTPEQLFIEPIAKQGRILTHKRSSTVIKQEIFPSAKSELALLPTKKISSIQGSVGFEHLATYQTIPAKSLSSSTIQDSELKYNIYAIKAVGAFNKTMEEISPFKEPILALSTEDSGKINGFRLVLGQFKIERIINN